MLTAFFSLWAAAAWNVYFYLAYRQRSVKGDVVLITGGGSGIGRLMALRFARLGAKVVLWDVNVAGMDKVKLEIVAIGGECDTYRVDVTDRLKVYETAKTVGRVDILINNAGIVTGKKLLECDDALMEKTMAVNTTSHFWTVKAFLPGMLERNSGHVVTIASLAGLQGVAGMVDYCASKFGAVGFHESLYMELRKLKSAVRTTLVCPFYINTGMFDGIQLNRLFPILEENWTADRIVKAIRRGEESFTMPWHLGIVPITKLLPAPWSAWIAEKIGISDFMTHDFKGRAGAPAAVAETPKTK